MGELIEYEPERGAARRGAARPQRASGTNRARLRYRREYRVLSPPYYNYYPSLYFSAKVT